MFLVGFMVGLVGLGQLMVGRFMVGQLVNLGQFMVDLSQRGSVHCRVGSVHGQFGLV